MEKMTYQESSPGILKHAGTVTFFTLLSRILGAARDLVIAHVFGAGWITDAFVQAFTIPNVLRRLTAEGAMNQAFLPLYTEIREKENRDEARLFASKSLGMVLLGTMLLTFLGIFFAPQLVLLFAAGFQSNAEQYQLCVELTRWMFPYLVLVSLVAWATGILNAESRFAAPAAAPMLLNLGIIGSAFSIAPRLDQPIFGIAIGVLIGGGLQVLLQVPSLKNTGQSLKPVFSLNDPKIRKLLKLLGPTLLGAGVYQINIILLRNLASFLPEGQVTHYYNASRLSELVLGVFAFGIVSASFPELSLSVAQENWSKLRDTLRTGTASGMLLVVPASAGLIVLAEPIVSMLFFHGAYQWDDVQQTALALQAFALSLPAVAVIRMLTSVYFSFQDTKTPVRIALIGIPVTGLLGWYWSTQLEVQGLALGLSAGTFFQLILMGWNFRKFKNFPQNWWPVRSIVVILIASLLMGWTVWWCSGFGNWQAGPLLFLNWLILTGSILTGVVLYLLMILMLREEQSLRLLKWVKMR